MPDEPSDLSLVETNDLIQELRKRFQSGFVLWAEWDDEGGKRHYRRHWEGTLSQAVGMSHRALDWLMREAEDEEGDED